MMISAKPRRQRRRRLPARPLRRRSRRVRHGTAQPPARSQGLRCATLPGSKPRGRTPSGRGGPATRLRARATLWVARRALRQTCRAWGRWRSRWRRCWKVRARARVRVRVGSPRSWRSPRAAAPPATAAGCRPWTAGPSGAAPAPALVTQCGCDGGRAACVSALQAAVIVRWALRALGSSQVCPRAASAPRCNEMQQMAWP